MKYTIMGFSQELIIKNNVTPREMIILQYIMDAQASIKMYHKSSEDNTPSYVWLTRDKILEDLPILDVSKERLTHIMMELKTKGLIESINEPSIIGGSKTFYRVSEKTLEMVTRTKDTGKSKTDRLESSETDEPYLSETDAPDISINTYNTIRRDIGGDNPNGLSDFANRRGELNNSYLDSQDTKTHNNNTFSKYECIREKCKKEIGAYTTDSKLQESLIKFLDMRIEKWKTSPKATLTLQSFKGYLKKLDTLDFKLEVVNQSTRNEWNTFYEVKPIYGKPKAYNAGVKSVAYTEQEKEEIEKWRKDNNVPSF